MTGPGLRTGSLRLRTIAAIMVLLTLMLAALAITVEVTLGSRLRSQIEERLSDRASAASALLGSVDGDVLAERLSAQGLSVLIRGSDGKSVAAGPSPEQLRKGPGALGRPARARPGGPTPSSGPFTGSANVKISSSTFTSDDQVITLVSKLSDGSTITLAAEAGSVGQTLTQLRWIMVGASAIFLLLTAGALALIVRQTLSPLDRMTTLARSITAGHRGRRLSPTRSNTELGRVAVALDEMLDVIEGAEGRALEAETRVRSFLSDAAHELRTPVAGMLAASDTLIRASPSESERERLAMQIAREAGRASRLVDDLLLLARVDDGLPLDLRPTDLGRLLAVECERLRMRHPSLDLRVEPVQVTVSVDADRLSQVFGNLVDNAARATGGTGTVALGMSLPAPDVVEIAVRDSGPGVPAADRERIFDRFVRLDSARDSVRGGAGLGLSIARGIATAHGGALACVPSGSGAASGSEFVLTLPVLAPSIPSEERSTVGNIDALHAFV